LEEATMMKRAMLALSVICILSWADSVIGAGAPLNLATLSRTDVCLRQTGELRDLRLVILEMQASGQAIDFSLGTPRLSDTGSRITVIGEVAIPNIVTVVSSADRPLKFEARANGFVYLGGEGSILTGGKQVNLPGSGTAQGSVVLALSGLFEALQAQASLVSVYDLFVDREEDLRQWRGRSASAFVKGFEKDRPVRRRPPPLLVPDATDRVWKNSWWVTWVFPNRIITAGRLDSGNPTWSAAQYDVGGLIVGGALQNAGQVGVLLVEGASCLRDNYPMLFSGLARYVSPAQAEEIRGARGWPVTNSIYWPVPSTAAESRLSRQKVGLKILLRAPDNATARMQLSQVGIKAPDSDDALGGIRLFSQIGPAPDSFVFVENYWEERLAILGPEVSEGRVPYREMCRGLNGKLNLAIGSPVPFCTYLADDIEPSFIVTTK
jgi:hypothetical protein